MRELAMVKVGYGNLVVASRVVAVLSPNSQPVRRLKEIAKNEHKLIDATQGRRTRSVIIMDSDHIILSSLLHDTIAQRIVNAHQKARPDGGDTGTDK